MGIVVPGRQKNVPVVSRRTSPDERADVCDRVAPRRPVRPGQIPAADLLFIPRPANQNPEPGPGSPGPANQSPEPRAGGRRTYTPCTRHIAAPARNGPRTQGHTRNAAHAMARVDRVTRWLTRVARQNTKWPPDKCIFIHSHAGGGVV